MKNQIKLLGIIFTLLAAEKSDAQVYYPIGSAGPGSHLSGCYFGTNSGIADLNGSSYNSFFGWRTGEVFTGGISYGANSFFGSEAGRSTTQASNNSFFGQRSGYSNTTGPNNTFIGCRAGEGNTTGGSNVMVGNLSGRFTTTGIFNTMIGTETGQSNVTGSYNTLMGYQANCSNGLTNANAIGYLASVTASNSMVLGNNDVKVGIGISAPTEKLTIRTSTWNDGLRITQTNQGFAGIRLENTSLGGKEWGLLSLGATNAQGPGNFLIYGYSGGGEALKIEGGSNNTIIGGGSLATSAGYKFSVFGDIIADNYVWRSDARLKKNIQPLTHAMDVINALEGVKYEFRDDIYYPQVDENGEKQRRVLPKGLQVGLIAQEVEKVLPEVVSTGTDGYKAVGYASIVPVLIEGIKEQQTIIEAQNTRIAKLEEKLTQLGTSGTTGNIGTTGYTSFTGAALYQNTPNPFNGQTEIHYKLPEKYNNAKIMVFDMNGREVKAILINGSGDGKVTFQNKSMVAGMYIYSLVIDGKEIDTKRMILSDR